MMQGRDKNSMAISFAPDPPSPRKRAIVYDVTHLTTRLQGVTTTGIDWVDRAYARHWAASERLACGLHYGLFSPHLLSPPLVAELSMRHERKFIRADASPPELAWLQLREWLTGRGDLLSPPRRRGLCARASSKTRRRSR